MPSRSQFLSEGRTESTASSAVSGKMLLDSGVHLQGSGAHLHLGKAALFLSDRSSKWTTFPSKQGGNAEVKHMMSQKGKPVKQQQRQTAAGGRAQSSVASPALSPPGD